MSDRQIHGGGPSLTQELTDGRSYIRYAVTEAEMEEAKRHIRTAVDDLARRLDMPVYGGQAVTVRMAERHYRHHPYHNFVHAMVTCLTADRLYQSFAEGTSEAGRRQLFIASLFHDAGHSGGKYCDAINIAQAISYLQLYEINLTVEGFNAAARMIQCTLFDNGRFPVAPVTLEQQCLRDADLLGFLSPVYPWLLEGLAQEVGPFTLQSNLKFLQGCMLFTPNAQQAMDEFIEFYTR
jgi:hypothetical protein